MPIWREGETTWTAGTTAVWDGYDPSYGVPVIASYPESWTFDVGAVETVETGSGPL